MFSDLLKKKMEEVGITQVELARKLGINKSSVHYWLTGRNPPKYEMLNRVASALDCRVSELVDKEQADEDILLSMFRQIPPDKRKLVLDMIQTAVELKE